jgi:hypothetical protein
MRMLVVDMVEGIHSSVDNVVETCNNGMEVVETCVDSMHLLVVELIYREFVCV